MRGRYGVGCWFPPPRTVTIDDGAAPAAGRRRRRAWLRGRPPPPGERPWTCWPPRSRARHPWCNKGTGRRDGGRWVQKNKTKSSGRDRCRSSLPLHRSRHPPNTPAQPTMRPPTTSTGAVTAVPRPHGSDPAPPGWEVAPHRGAPPLCYGPPPPHKPSPPPPHKPSPPLPRLQRDSLHPGRQRGGRGGGARVGQPPLAGTSSSPPVPPRLSQRGGGCSLAPPRPPAAAAATPAPATDSVDAPPQGQGPPQAPPPPPPQIPQPPPRPPLKNI